MPLDDGRLQRARGGGQSARRQRGGLALRPRGRRPCSISIPQTKPSATKWWRRSKRLSRPRPATSRRSSSAATDAPTSVSAPNSNSSLDPANAGEWSRIDDSCAAFQYVCSRCARLGVPVGRGARSGRPSRGSRDSLRWTQGRGLGRDLHGPRRGGRRLGPRRGAAAWSSRQATGARRTRRPRRRRDGRLPSDWAVEDLGSALEAGALASVRADDVIVGEPPTTSSTRGRRPSTSPSPPSPPPPPRRIPRPGPRFPAARWSRAAGSDWSRRGTPPEHDTVRSRQAPRLHTTGGDADPGHDGGARETYSSWNARALIEVLPLEKKPGAACSRSWTPAAITELDYRDGKAEMGLAHCSASRASGERGMIREGGHPNVAVWRAPAACCSERGAQPATSLPMQREADPQRRVAARQLRLEVHRRRTSRPASPQRDAARCTMRRDLPGPNAISANAPLHVGVVRAAAAPHRGPPLRVIAGNSKAPAPMPR